MIEDASYELESGSASLSSRVTCDDRLVGDGFGQLHCPKSKAFAFADIVRSSTACRLAHALAQSHIRLFVVRQLNSTHLLRRRVRAGTVQYYKRSNSSNITLQFRVQFKNRTESYLSLRGISN